ncbi:MAG: aromatic-ring-hydroxylating dioxygenase subunit beta [Rhodospirillaceae bacterium]|nr:aromatic-ring-hydroxylating dioxygenase subunit beta [Rhodospirillaceae bacterium]
MTFRLTRDEAEEFVFAEAEFLDDWDLEAWLDLFADDAVYNVPSTDLDKSAKAADNLFYIADDRTRLEERVTRLKKKTAHAEFPRSKTRHLVSNVRIRKIDDESATVTAAFATFRSKDGVTDTYIGSTRYKLVRPNGALKIAEKWCFLDMEGLRPQGRISILL